MCNRVLGVHVWCRNQKFGVSGVEGCSQGCRMVKSREQSVVRDVGRAWSGMWKVSVLRGVEKCG